MIMTRFTLEQIKHLVQLRSKGNTFAQYAGKLEVIEAANGRCICEVPIDASNGNMFGIMHGGYACLLVDLVSTFALLTQRNVRNVSVNMDINYVSGALVGSRIKCDARVVRLGKSLVFLNVDVTNSESRKLLVKGYHTKFLFDGVDYYGKKIASGLSSTTQNKDSSKSV